jgi:high-affinity nickel-transport protein
MKGASSIAALLQGKTRLMLWLLAAANVLIWSAAVAAFHTQPVLLGTALLAYLLGLRHAVDADHIAAIDNVTRKLVQTRVPPVAVGLYFSLGHSTVVVIACAVIASASLALRESIERWHATGNVIGTVVSASFLFVIAIANILMLVSMYRAQRGASLAVKGGARAGEMPALQTSWLGRLLRPVLALVTQPWHMYGLGFLFGLGFDTASEVALLAISASQASSALPFWSVMLFPALFTAGMSLVDTLDGVVMARAYGWALTGPSPRVRYNITITLVSVIVALIVGSIQVAALLEQQGVGSGLIVEVAALEEHFVALGAGIAGLLLGCWAMALLLARRHAHR